MRETTKLRKVGNSAGISLPKEVVKALHLHLGEELRLTIRGDCLIIRKVHSLKDLLATVAENSSSEEWKGTGTRGKELVDDEQEKNNYCPDRGDICFLDMDPTAGIEQAKRRPVLVISYYEFNRKLGLAYVCPITSTPPRHGFHLKLSNGMMTSAR